MRDYFRPKTWLITMIMFVVAFGLSSVIVYNEFGLKKNILVSRASASDNASGWAWNSNIGWISFNCTDDTPACGSSNYGVSVDSNTGVFSGYAWSSSVGWISFNRSDTGDPPGQPYQNGTFLAKYTSGINEVDGWAKILSMGDDGWIKFRKFSADTGSDYGVSINPASGDFSGWAWNANNTGSGIGWISFNCANESPPCSGTNYKVNAEINNPPTVANMSAPNWNFSQASQSGALNAYLDWIFSDPDAGSSESAYQIIVNTQNNTSNPFFDSGKCVAFTPSGKCKVNPGVGHFPLQLALSSIPDSLDYNESYYWWIKVWDQHDVASDLIQYDVLTDTPAEADDNANKTFTTYKHKFPLVNATWFPLEPSRGEKVKFTDQSQRYLWTAPDTAVDCDISICQWTWTAPGATVENPTASSTNIIFNVAGAGKTVTLRVTDLTDTGNTAYYSERTFNIDVNAKLPKWKEVKPE